MGIETREPPSTTLSPLDSSNEVPDCAPADKETKSRGDLKAVTDMAKVKAQSGSSFRTHRGFCPRPLVWSIAVDNKSGRCEFNNCESFGDHEDEATGESLC